MMNVKQKIIIFDGPDGCGKTNIAKALSKEMNIPYFKVSTEYKNWKENKFKEALEFDQTYIREFLSQTGYSVIIDRAYPAEWVYSKVYKRETNDELLDQLDIEFSKMNTVIIVPLRNNYDVVNDELVKGEEIEKLHNFYLKFCDWTCCHNIEIYVDTFYDDINKQLPVLMKTLDYLYNKSDMTLKNTYTLDRRNLCEE